MSLLDGFSQYNQVLVDEDVQYKTAFTTPWGTYAYICITFGLINVSATFQRTVDISFCRLIYKSVVVYLDDVVVFYKQSDHVFNL